MFRAILDRLKSPGRARAEKAKAELKANAEKALRMKQEAGSAASIPPHRTAAEGMHAETAGSATDPALARQATFSSQRKRSGRSRSGDA